MIKVILKIDIVNSLDLIDQANKRKTFKIGIYGCKEIIGLIVSMSIHKIK